jgi:hypothetical protein
MTVRTTFALDVGTEQAIERLAALWKTSKAEVVRRSVAASARAAAEQAKPSPLDALEWLQENGKLTEPEVARWEEQSRRGWEEAWKARGRASTPPRRRKAKSR